MDGLHGKEVDMAGGRRVLTDKEMDKEQRDGQGRMDYNKRIYSKEATVIVDMADQRDARAEDIIKAVNERIGGGKILAVRPRQVKEYEITLINREACDGLDEGLMIKGKLCEIRQLKTREYVVSFIHLPAYIEDSDILIKLQNWGVTPVSDIIRRMYPGTDIADGTRYLRVKFPKEVVSLPYSTKFDTEEGTQYFRIMHDRQVKTCRLCMNPGHVFKDCPDFKCHQCNGQGHYARDCDAIKCPDCRKVIIRCECWMENEIQNKESEGVGGRMSKETELQNGGENEEEDGVNKEAIVENKKELEEKRLEGEMDKGILTSQEVTQGVLEEMENQGLKEKEEEMQEITEEEKEMELEEKRLEGEMDKGILTSQEVTQGALEEMENQGLKEKEEEMQEITEEEKGVDRMDDRKDKRVTLRRRTLKVIPNVNVARKKRHFREKYNKGKHLFENKFQVLREDEEEEVD